MRNTRSNSWQDIRDRIRTNIQNRTWLPGQLIPGEEALAQEFGCARTTVNRALRELAVAGVIDRKRKAGTRVSMQHTRRVSADIPIIRLEVEAQGKQYRARVLEQKVRVPAKQIRQTMALGDEQRVMYLRTLHLADAAPFAYEERWINTATIPGIQQADLHSTSANEWLVQHVPFTRGGFTVEAVAANRRVTTALELSAKATVLRSCRDTWIDAQSVTLVWLYYPPGYLLQFVI
jgi:GntR family histidine utilization transcriptional repressor